MAPRKKTPKVPQEPVRRSSRIRERDQARAAAAAAQAIVDSQANVNTNAPTGRARARARPSRVTKTTKSTAKKAAPKKAPAKKAAPKKAPAKKTAPAKKAAPARKPSAKRAAPAKKKTQALKHTAGKPQITVQPRLKRLTKKAKPSVESVSSKSSSVPSRASSNQAVKNTSRSPSKSPAKSPSSSFSGRLTSNGSLPGYGGVPFGHSFNREAVYGTATATAYRDPAQDPPSPARARTATPANPVSSAQTEPTPRRTPAPKEERYRSM